MASKPLTKPGAHGTLYRYAIVYTDKYDDCCPHDTWHCWAYSLEHAEEKFYDRSVDQWGDGWRIVSLARVSDAASQHRAVRHAPRGGS